MAKVKSTNQDRIKKTDVPTLDDIINSEREKWKGKSFKLNKEDEENCDEYPMPYWRDENNEHTGKQKQYTDINTQNL